MPVPLRKEIQPGMLVQVIEKNNQRRGIITEGVVARILTRTSSHPYGIKVMLDDGRVGRVQAVVQPSSGKTT
jgi:uncharacterized repeat protein (TIGR03833 family)